MQSVSSRIWTRVAVFISYDDNDYTTGTSYMVAGKSLLESLSHGGWAYIYIYIYIYIYTGVCVCVYV